MPAERVIDDLCRCLDHARDAVRTGNYERLAIACSQLDGEIAALAALTTPVPARLLEQLRDRAARQLLLLDAARDGIRAAVLRVQETRRLTSELSTYDREGRGRTVRFGTEQVEHRA